MRDIRSLRPAATASTTPAVSKPAWGNSQRFLVVGLVVFLLAAIAAVILFEQVPAHFSGLPSPDAMRQTIKRMSIEESRWFFHHRILPGIEVYEQPAIQSKRSMVYLGMATLASLGAIGLIVAGVGVAGIVRRR